MFLPPSPQLALTAMSVASRRTVFVLLEWWPFTRFETKHSRVCLVESCKTCGGPTRCCRQRLEHPEVSAVSDWASNACTCTLIEGTACYSRCPQRAQVYSQARPTDTTAHSRSGSTQSDQLHTSPRSRPPWVRRTSPRGHTSASAHTGTHSCPRRRPAASQAR